jgi:hypothetical protein
MGAAACSHGSSTSASATTPAGGVGRVVPGSGSGGPSGGPTTGPSATTSPSPTGACANDHFAVIPHAVRVYAIRTDSTTADARQTIVDVHPAAFTTALVTPRVIQRESWTCGPTGLVGLGTQPLVGPEATGEEFVAATSRSAGVTIPKNLYVGAAWTQTVTARGTIEHDGTGYAARRVAQIAYRVVGARSITTPAGTSRALRMEVTSTVRTTSPSAGIDDSEVTNAVVWIGADVGVVASVSHLGGITTTTRLLDYEG